MNRLKFNFGGPVAAPNEFKEFIRRQKEKPAAFIHLPFAGEEFGDVKASKSGVIVVGIGGSNLGALAVWRALRPPREIGFAETLDARRLGRMLEHAPAADILIISKSGTTTETIANAAVILGKIKDWKRVRVITDPGSPMERWAKENGVASVASPPEVAGRYSVFSAVGLLPLALAGVKTGKLLRGARDITDACLSDNLDENPAALSALAIWQNWKAGKTIHDTFIFEPDLEGWGKWYRQLTGESVGKQGKGITPTVSIGTTDLHSVAQLYLDGPKDKFTTFVSVRDHGQDFVIKSGITSLVPDIAGKKFGAVLGAVLAGVKTTYQKRGLPFGEIELKDVSEESLGALLQMKMMEMVYLGQLMGVNPFDNPAVEAYKEETKKLLQNL